MQYIFTVTCRWRSQVFFMHRYIKFYFKIGRWHWSGIDWIMDKHAAGRCPFWILFTNQSQSMTNSNQPKIADLLRNNLKQLKVKIDSNHKSIQECNELLNQIKSNCNELDSLANQFWFFILITNQSQSIPYSNEQSIQHRSWFFW